MDSFHVTIRGLTGLLQHRFPDKLPDEESGAIRRAGRPSYDLEWMEGMYTTPDGYLCQPADHLEGALARAAANFAIKGKKGKTWREAIRAYCYVLPELIIHQRDGTPVRAPGPDLRQAPTPTLSVNRRRVVINRAAVPRARLLIAPGWELAFTIEVHEPQVRPDVVEQILIEAGHAVGIGDFRPKFGRFDVVRFMPAPA